MEEIKVLREVEVPAYKFEAVNCLDQHYSITIVNGEIEEVSNWETRGFYEKKKGDSNFDECCYKAIGFIVDHDPKELKNIYHVLNEGDFKDFCKDLQAEKIAELQFYSE